MNQRTPSSRNELRSIARRVMTARGLLPDFSPAVLAETAAVTEASTDPAPSVRDLSGLRWVSIDNDDSRDLDQLSVAPPIGRRGEDFRS